MYLLQGLSKENGWETIETSDNLETIYAVKEEKVTPKKYYSYIIKKRTKEGDDLVESKQLFEECQVEYSDDVKPKYEVKAITFKPSRMKEKEELRRMAKDYIDR